jgi:hypothetical protein
MWKRKVNFQIFTFKFVKARNPSQVTSYFQICNQGIFLQRLWILHNAPFCLSPIYIGLWMASALFLLLPVSANHHGLWFSMWQSRKAHIICSFSYLEVTIVAICFLNLSPDRWILRWTWSLWFLVCMPFYHTCYFVFVSPVTTFLLLISLFFLW